MGMRAHVVERGQDVASLAARLGLTADEVWALEENRALRELRGDAGVLAAGDVLYLPDEPQQPERLTPRATNRFEASLSAVRLRVTLSTGGPEPLGDEPYELEGLSSRGAPRRGQTDAHGVLDEWIPGHVREVRVFLPRRRARTVLTLGRLAPLATPEGLTQRLEHLGHLLPRGLLPELTPPGQQASQHELARALASFQRAFGLPETGALDEATRAALTRAHGA
jgi:hypothetical protein